MATRVINDIGTRSERPFFTGMALLVLFISVIGFSRSYYFSSWTDAKPLLPIVHLHGAVMTLWTLLFLTQTSLIATRRIETHRRLGMLGLLLAGAVVATSLATVMTTRGEGRLNLAVPAEVFIVFPVGLALMFGVLVGLAAYFYRDGPTHKRLMLLATLAAMATPIARMRLPFLPAGAIGGNLALIPLIITIGLHDVRMMGRPHPVTLWGGLFVVAMLPARLAFAHTPIWHHFAMWLGVR